VEENSNRDELFRARVRSVDGVVAAGVAIERLAIGHGLQTLEATRFRFVVEELCSERLAHAFGSGEHAEARIVLEQRPGEFVVTITDAGSPIGATEAAAGAKGWIAQLLSRGFADRLHASFEGREGNRCEIAKFLDKAFKSRLQDSAVGGSATRSEVEADVAPARPAAAAAPPVEISYRDMTPDDAHAVATCFYRTYGFTAPVADEVVYHPDKFAALVRGGLHLGTVAELSDGSIVGHIAVSREHPDDPIGVSGFLVVDPQFRGHGIADALSDRKRERGKRAGMKGMLGMAVTVHTASQKTSRREGGREVGLLLAAQEDRIAMRGIAADARHERHSILPFFTRLGAQSSRRVYPPGVYREIAGQIYRECELARELAEPAAFDPGAMPEHSALNVAVLEGARFARIRAASYGRDFLTEIFHLVSDLHRHHVNVIRLEMPLVDPLTAHFGRATEELGFSFASIFPEMQPGDLLCVQSLDRVDIDPTAIHVASDHGERLLAAVLASRERVLSSMGARTLESATAALKERS
jgi:ribosomal protein S18 acetylase RimI-like enzyme/anti-sigma regulatory factor (Ser/Thr protein kinase)